MKTRLLLLIIVASLHLIPATVFASHGWIGFFEGSFKGKFINAQTNQPLLYVIVFENNIPVIKRYPESINVVIMMDGSVNEPSRVKLPN